MEILFVGTGSSHYLKCLSCPCTACRYAREHGGKNLRTYSSTLFNASLLVDCGPTAAWRLRDEDVSLADVENVLITHPHPDHFDLGALQQLADPIDGRSLKLHVWGNREVIQRLRQAQSTVPADLHVLVPEVPVRINDVDIIPLIANHGPLREPGFNFVIDSEGTSCLYAIDSGWPTERMFSLLAGRALHLAIIEATYGPYAQKDLRPPSGAHLNWVRLFCFRDVLCANGALRGDGYCIASHLSMHHNPSHEEVATRLGAHDVLTAWDGMRMTVQTSGDRVTLRV